MTANRFAAELKVLARKAGARIHMYGNSVGVLVADDMDRLEVELGRFRGWKCERTKCPGASHPDLLEVWKEGSC